jgi:hypothetical protein
MKTKTKMHLVSVYNCVDETRKLYTYETNVHNRINHKATSLYHIKEISKNYNRIKTKEERLEDYEFKCIEQGIKPFHFTNAQWEEVLIDIENEEHYERCLAKHNIEY